VEALLLLAAEETSAKSGWWSILGPILGVVVGQVLGYILGQRSERIKNLEDKHVHRGIDSLVSWLGQVGAVKTSSNQANPYASCLPNAEIDKAAGAVSRLLPEDVALLYTEVIRVVRRIASSSDAVPKPIDGDKKVLGRVSILIDVLILCRTKLKKKPGLHGRRLHSLQAEIGRMLAPVRPHAPVAHTRCGVGRVIDVLWTWGRR